MSETLNLAFTGINILPSGFLCLSLFYWLLMLVGLVDLDLFDLDLDIGPDLDVDVDVDVDVDAAGVGGHSGGLFHSTLSFLNLGHVPFMIVFSILTFITWVISMLISLIPMFGPTSIFGIILFIPTLIFSIVLTHVITKPLARGFKAAESNYDTGAKVMGEYCTLLCDVSPGRLGQADLTSNEKHIVINVKTRGNLRFKKGDTAEIIDEEGGGNVFIIDKVKS